MQGALWSLTALLVVAAIFLPMGQKSVEEVSCSGDWRSGRVCEHDAWNVEYQLLSMQTHHVQWTNEDHRRETNDWAFAYTSSAPHPTGITPLLAVGGFAAVPAALATLAAGIWHGIRPTRLSRGIHLGSWTALALALAAFLVGMAIHSGTWVAQQAGWWQPGPGLLALGALASGWGLLPQRESFAMPALPS